MQDDANETKTASSGTAGGATPQTATCDAPITGLATRIYSIYVSNEAGGTATVATVEIQNNANSAVLWHGAVASGTAPSLSGNIGIGTGGVYQGAANIRLKVVVAQVGATGLTVNVRYKDVPATV